jgi:hypothetical protein
MMAAEVSPELLVGIVIESNSRYFREIVHAACVI